MNEIKVNKQELIATIKDNLKKHKVDYEEALILRREKIKNIFKEEIKKIDGDKSYQTNVEFIYSELKPKNNTKSYEKALQKLEMSVDEFIELSDEDFNELVLDEWHWKREFLTSSLRYKS